MTTAHITVDREFTVGPVPRRLFGSFVEHMGRCVYTGIYEPGHPEADEHGYRQDVLALTRDMGVSIVRYPGGNFVSGYMWEDGIGPVPDRPRRIDGAWHTIETNAFGLHEFAGWAEQANVEIQEAINLGTAGVEEARAIVEYANHPGGTAWSDKRRANGAEDPFGIKVWNLGNELDGPWQIGHKTADEYGRIAQEAGKAMKLVDPSIELIAVGSSSAHMPTFGEWEYDVLSHAYDEVDYISLHAYYQEHDGDAKSFLASANDMDYFIESVISTVDAVKAKRQTKKQINLSFDEWNVWYQQRGDADDQLHVIEAKAQWQEHPRLIEDTYNVTDAVVVGTYLNSLLRHGDRVTIANQAQLVNVIAPIRSEANGPAWRQTIYWPFARTAELARGEILRTVASGDQFESKEYGDADLVDASVTYDAERGRVAVFFANRGLDESADVTVSLRGFTAGRVTRAEVLTAPESGDRFTANTEHEQDVVGLVALDAAAVVEGELKVTLPALSWAVVEVEVTEA
ncbi:alpha-N-arabinofuranosidase [Curtobacterium sp. RRHDQ10]|uniref:arabinosylfuranosidase ArfA n=1 Tax=Curtobacterium phyllosphaerae TaxID=3413379 RepID=UPI003BF3524F